MINFGVSHFVGIFMTIALFAYLTNLLQWGLYQVVKTFFEDEKRPENIFHHHYHYKADR